VTLSVGTDPMCRAVSDIFARLGDRWTLLVVVALRERPRRFNDIKREVAGISQQMLTRTLKGLERDGLLTRTVSDTSPPQVEYALSALGSSLGETVRQLAQWAGKHRPSIEENRIRYDAGH
jgi:DNA-binding HxlR family transcriptional regulator